MSDEGFEYGRHGVIGIAPPQSNPTVEPEMAALLPAGVNMVVTRLRGHPTDGRRRFLDYLANLEESIAAFGDLKPQALGYACTSTGYLVGAEHEDSQLAEISKRTGFPIVSSSQAVRRALAKLGARSVDLLSPYPAWLTEASVAYWEHAGHRVISVASVLREGVDLLDIYKVRTSTVMSAVEELSGTADVVLLAGTGMASLRAIPQIAERLSRPVISSNLCLAWALLDELGLAERSTLGAGETLLSWRSRAKHILD